MNRATSLGLVVATIALGVASRVLRIGVSIWDKSLGDVAYAIMIAFILSFLAPRARSVVIGASAIALCFVVELFQLTGVPARSPRLVQIALGTTFAWHDMACYAIGGTLAALLHGRLTRSQTGSK